jgi:hypothetical protein
MVTLGEFRALASAHGLELRPGFDVVVAPASSLSALIDLAEGLDLVILGLDGFNLDGAVVVPLLDFIADFSAIEGTRSSRVHASASEARVVIREWAPWPDLVEVTLDGLDD